MGPTNLALDFHFASRARPVLLLDSALRDPQAVSTVERLNDLRKVQTLCAKLSRQKTRARPLRNRCRPWPLVVTEDPASVVQVRRS